MSYLDRLISAGTSRQAAEILVKKDEMALMANREHPMYGRYNPDPPTREEVRQAYEFKMGVL